MRDSRLFAGFIPTRIRLIWRAMNFQKLLLVALLGGFCVAGCARQDDWRTASRESAGLAPDPVDTREAVVHVYGADAWGWRGWFAIHTWIAVKRKDEDFYTLYDVIGWRGYYQHQVMDIYRDIPDRYWYGAKPRLIRAHQGGDAEELIEAVDTAARSYPWKNTYKAFPGPNSNTFTAWIAQQVPALDLYLPFSAIGSGYADLANQ